MNSGIYLIQNKVNGKVYVGSAVNIQKRWREHKKDLRKGKHHSQRLQHSWNKHGEDNFQFIVIELCQPKNLIKLEQFMLDLLCSYEDDKGYNICPTAGSQLGLKRSKETKRKIAEANRKNAKGFYYHKASGKYYSRIGINGKKEHLGLYNTPEEARAAYLAALDKVQQKPSVMLPEEGDKL